jgi:ABC-type dipeptide/oligopeptide/nickel transport system permease subunit
MASASPRVLSKAHAHRPEVHTPVQHSKSPEHVLAVSMQEQPNPVSQKPKQQSDAVVQELRPCGLHVALRQMAPVQLAEQQSAFVSQPAPSAPQGIGVFVGVSVGRITVCCAVFVGVCVSVVVGVCVGVAVGVFVGVLVGVLVAAAHTPKPLPFLLLPGGGFLAPVHCRPGQQL